MKNKYLTKGACVGGTLGNYCPGVGVDITLFPGLFPGNVCVVKKVGIDEKSNGTLQVKPLL